MGRAAALDPGPAELKLEDGGHAERSPEQR